MKILFILLLFIFLSCNQSKKMPDQETIQEPLISANKKMVGNESLEIDAYIKRRNLEMVRTGTGLRYMMVKEGEGKNPKAEDLVTVHYKISLLDGTLCYSSDDSGSKSFVVDHDHVESGLHEGIKLMKKGGKTKFILPSHLAHGLSGDRDKIPSMAVVVYDIELIEINSNL